MTIDEALELLGEQAVGIANSGWLDEFDGDWDALYAEWSQRFDAVREEAVASLGAPAVDDHAWGKGWYPESLRLSAWSRDGRRIYLALVHHDQTTPVGVELGLVPDDAPFPG